jgi:hypothetical protein
VLRSHGDGRGDVYPVGRPDPVDLERFMFEVDAPHAARRTSDGRREAQR